MKKYRIGFTAGVFDLFHVGHLNMLERCKAQCKYLIVAVCDDDYVRNIKHKEPVIPLEDRMRIISALKCVDEVVPLNIEATENKLIPLKQYRFDVLFAGDDWKGTPRYIRTEKEFAELGSAIEYLPYTKGVSTTELKTKMSKESKQNV